MPNELRDLDVTTVSLVDRAAVRDSTNKSEPMRLLLWKREGDPTPEGGTMTEQEMRAAVEKAERDATELRKQLEEQTTLKADLKKAQDEVAELKKATTADDSTDDDDLSKADLPEAVRKRLEKAEQAAEQAEKDAIERIAKAEKVAQESADIAKAERDARVTREFITKAEAYRALPVEAEKFGPVLKSVSEKLTKEEAEAIDTLLKAVDEQIAAGELFKEQGRGGTAPKADSAVAEVQRKAEDLRKSDANLRPDQAMDRVLNSDRALQERYLAEMRG